MPSISLKLLNEISYLLEIHMPQSCPKWEDGKGDCGSMECPFCRGQQCVDDVDLLIIKEQKKRKQK